MTLKQKLLDRIPVSLRQSGIMLVGDVVSKFLTFLITMLLLRLVTPEDYGLYGVFITLLAFINHFTDSGIHSSFIRFYALYRTDQPDRATAYMHFSFRLKLVLVLITGVLVFLTSDIIAVSIMRLPRLVPAVRILSLGIIASGLYEFISIVFQGQQRFLSLTALRLTEALVKIGYIFVAYQLGFFSLNVVYQAYIVAPGVICIVVLFRIRLPFQQRDYSRRDIRSEMFRFGKWIMISSFTTMFLLRLDIFMLARMMSDRPAELGYYNAAVRLCIPLLVMAGSLSTVLFPKAMALKDYDEMKAYVWQSLRVSVPLLFVSIVYWGVMVFAIPRFFPSYEDAVLPFSILFLGYAWTIVGNPITMLVLSMNKSAVAATINLVQLILTAVSHYVLISYYGAQGAAISTVLMWFIAGTVSMVYVYRHRFIINTIYPTP